MVTIVFLFCRRRSMLASRTRAGSEGGIPLAGVEGRSRPVASKGDTLGYGVPREHEGAFGLGLSEGRNAPWPR